MNLVESEIKKIIEDQGYLYFRTININDLNEQVGNQDIAQGIGVYSSLPSIVNTTFGLTNNILMAYSIEVYYLKLNFYTDDKGTDIDLILNDLYPDAQQFYDRLRQSGIVANGNNIESYQLDAVDTLKMTKEVLTGWRIQLDIPIFRNDFYCQPKATFNTLTESGVGQISLNGGDFSAFIVGDNVNIKTLNGIYNVDGPVLTVGSSMTIGAPFSIIAGPGTVIKI